MPTYQFERIVTNKEYGTIITGSPEEAYLLLKESEPNVIFDVLDVKAYNVVSVESVSLDNNLTKEDEDEEETNQCGCLELEENEDFDQELENLLNAIRRQQ